MSERLMRMTGPDRPELDDLLDKSKKLVENMSPLERAKMYHEQKRSWVRGEMLMGLHDSHNMNKDEANRILNYLPDFSYPEMLEEKLSI